MKKKHFAKAQESARKDVELAFGVLQACFAIVRGPARFWDEETLADIMKACIIMHNMVIEDEGDIGNNDFDGSDANPPVEVSHAYTPYVTPIFKHISFKPFQICGSVFVHYGRPINI